MSAIIAYDVSSQQAITATFTKLQQQLLAQVAAGTGLTWFMENRKEMSDGPSLQYAFAKRASNRKFKQEIEAKWLIMRTLRALKEKMDKLMACAIAKAAQELRKRQQSEVGGADQPGTDSRKKGEQVAKAEDAMEVDGTGPSGMLKAQMEKGKGKAMDMAASGAVKAMEEIMVCKIVVPKKRATAKSKLMVGSETNEVGEAGPPVASQSKAKPRKGSLALPKVEIVERNMHGTTRLPSLGPTNDRGRRSQELTSHGNTILANLSHALAQLQVPPP
ncbi:hypothetical protein BDN71DRAFT_1435858 [Pleurotus eryngii]|uniref:Uncharacterized protein n=1 Tax=Pleurotus eryngii TaxID=5323 RepID=A0A9P5ZJB8_PLEER|nr:hypothetical protein BDN71DRAFT_1435858 [Pleurotus eryngii]